MKTWTSSWKWWTIIEPIPMARIVPIICCLSIDKGWPPNHDERGMSPNYLMSVTLKLWKHMGSMPHVPLGHAPILLELVEISLTLVNCRCASVDSERFNCERLEYVLRKSFIRILFSIDPFAHLINMLPHILSWQQLFLSSVLLCF